MNDRTTRTIVILFNGDSDPESLLDATAKLARSDCADLVAILSDPRGPTGHVLLLDALRAIGPKLSLDVLPRAKRNQRLIEELLVRQAIQASGASVVLCGAESTSRELNITLRNSEVSVLSVTTPDWDTRLADAITPPPDAERAPKPSAASGAGKLRLALVTPWPPQQTGIARHALVMERALREHYHVTVVTKQTNDRTPGVAFMKPKEFRAGAESFDRVLYQMGNSPFHEFILPMLTSIPGVVVMHDGQFTEWFNGTRGAASAEISSLSYGEGGLRGWLERDTTGVDLVRSSLGLIVHSGVGSARLLSRPSAFPADFVRRAPLTYTSVESLPERDAARHELHLAPTDVLVATFGRVHPTKRTLEFIRSAAAAAGSMSNPRSIRIAVVGQSANQAYLKELNDFAESAEGDVEITLTGALDGEDFIKWVMAADIAVQLRSEDHGESSAALIEAMASPAAVIVEDTGSMGEILDGTGIVLESSELGTLGQTIAELIRNPARRQSLGQASASLEADRHSPRSAAASYHRAIEYHYKLRDPSKAIESIDSAYATEKSLRSAINRLATSRNDREADRLVLDVTEIVSGPPVTGIQRVQERLSSELVHAWNGRFLHGTTNGGDLRETTQLAAVTAKNPPPEPSGLGRLKAKPGDWLFSARYFPDASAWETQAYAWRSNGGRVAHLVHDLFPITNPEWFPAYAAEYFSKYLETVLRTSDTLLTNSESTLEALAAYLSESPLRPHRDVELAAIRLGSDFGSLQKVRNRHRPNAQFRALMVGTVEPRKGYADVLAAFQLLESSRPDLRLTIVGRRGWGTETLFDLLSATSHADNNVEWLDDCSDAELSQLYQDTDLLIAASHGEGFGLPLLEASRVGLPILARDIRVFREVVGDSASYFPRSATAAQLADAVGRAIARKNFPVEQYPAVTEWSDAARQVSEALNGERVHARWMPESGVSWL